MQQHEGLAFTPLTTVMLRSAVGGRSKVKPTARSEDSYGDSDDVSEINDNYNCNVSDAENGRREGWRRGGKRQASSSDQDQHDYDPHDGDQDVDSIQDVKIVISVLGASSSRLRRIDQSWTEKIWMCVDALQIFALLWSLSQPWPWPRPWLAGSRFVVLANLDIVSIFNAAMAVTGPGNVRSPWGERTGYILYGAIFAVIPVMIIGVWVGRGILTTLWLNRSMFLNRYVLGRGKAPAPTSATLSFLAAFEGFLIR